jgi:amidase
MSTSIRRVSRRMFLSGGTALLGSALLPISKLERRASVSNPGGHLSELSFVSALGAARAIRTKEVSSAELTRHQLDRIERYNPPLNAVVTLMREEAMARARAADEALARDEWWGPFHGVPCTIKDTFEVAGVRTTSGAPQLANYVSRTDSVFVARLRAAGAVFLGKTNVPIWASDLQSYNEVFGTTNNPWDVTRTPGGSTGGGAAALAAGLGYLSIGSDIGGSIRIPAHFCGVYGHKPTLNLVSRRGQIVSPPGGPPSPPTDLAVAGPLARSAADLKTVLEVVGGPDSEDAIAYRWSLPPARGSRLTDYRIGFVLDDKFCPVTAEVKEVLATAIEALRKNGVTLEEGWPAGVVPAAQYDTFIFLRDSYYGSLLRDDQLEEMRKRAADQDGSYEAKRALAWTAPHKHFLAASGARMAARAVWQEYFRTHDAFLMPTTFIPAFPHDHSQPNEKRIIRTPEGPRKYSDMAFWISFATLTGLPATTAPVGLTREGLPVGIQILGPYLEDATPIDVAGGLTDVIGGFRPPKGYQDIA